MVETVTKRLKDLRESTEPRVTVRAMADALGLAHSSYAFYEDSKKGFKGKTLPMELTKSIADILAERGIDRDEVMALAGVDAGGGLQVTSDELAGRLGLTLIKELELGYSMGGGSVFDEFSQRGIVPFRSDWLRGIARGAFTDLFVARGEGDSMQPTLMDGDIVLIDTSQKAIKQQDRIWAVAWGDLGMIKRVRRLPGGTYQLLSDNPAVSPINAADEEMAVIGRVVWIGRQI